MRRKDNEVLHKTNEFVKLDPDGSYDTFINCTLRQAMCSNRHGTASIANAHEDP